MADLGQKCSSVAGTCCTTLFTVTEYYGTMVVSAEITECKSEHKPYFYKLAGRIRDLYVRVGEGDEPMTEYEVYSYEVYKRKICDELCIADHVVMNDFNKEILNKYFSKFCLEKTACKA